MVFTLKDYEKNEAINEVTKNAVELVERFGTQEEIIEIHEIAERHTDSGISYQDSKRRFDISNKYYQKLVDEKYQAKTNVWGSTQYSRLNENKITKHFEDTFESFHDGLNDYYNKCRLCKETIRQGDSWNEEILEKHLVENHSEVFVIEN